MNYASIANYWKYFKRNLQVSISRGDKVIDIGSGHAPLIRADILCDCFPCATPHRPVSGVFMPPGRFVVGDVQELPFATKSFDFAYSRALLEHVQDPIKACGELSRIAHKGLLILPSILWEVMGGAKAHLWMIRSDRGKLIFQRKSNDYVRINSQIPAEIRNSQAYEKLFYTFYEHFFIEFHWADQIAVEVISDGHELGEITDPCPITGYEVFRNQFRSPRQLRRRVKMFLFEMVRRAIGGQTVTLNSVLACPICKNRFVRHEGGKITCGHCSLEYPVKDRIPFLLSRFAVPIHDDVYSQLEYAS